MSDTPKPYEYFDTPDGYDVDKKLLCALKPAAIAAFFLGTCDVMLWSHPKGYLPTIGRYLYVGLPIIGATTALVATTTIATNIRKKDDQINWFAGGYAAGGVFGTWYRNPHVGFILGFALATAAAGYKYGKMVGFEFIPNAKPIAGTGRSWTYSDWTLTKERPRNWTTGKE